jgi:hypothetical protein
VLIGGFVVVVVLATVTAVLLPWVLKRRRRARRRRAPDAATRVVGAWREVLDRLVEAGDERVTALTSRQATAAVAARFGDEAAALTRELGRFHDAALHDRAEPPADWGERAWQLSDEVVARARRTRAVRTRIGAALNGAPLRATALEPDPRDRPAPVRRASRPAPDPSPGPGGTTPIRLPEVTERSPEKEPV